MASTYTPIATTTLGSAAADITFSSISGYTDLVLIADTQSDGGSSGNLRMRFNSDSGSNYSRTIMYGTGSSAGSARSTNDTNITISVMPTVSQGYKTIARVNIQNYANSTTYKSTVSRADLLNDAALAVVGLWRNTAAITSITLSSSVGNLATGSTFTLYGIKAA